MIIAGLNKGWIAKLNPFKTEQAQEAATQAFGSGSKVFTGVALATSVIATPTVGITLGALLGGLVAAKYFSAKMSDDLFSSARCKIFEVTVGKLERDAAASGIDPSAVHMVVTMRNPAPGAAPSTYYTLADLIERRDGMKNAEAIGHRFELKGVNDFDITPNNFDYARSIIKAKAFEIERSIATSGMEV